MIGIFFVAAAISAGVGGGENLVRNGDFSRREGDRPEGWVAAGDGNVLQRLEVVREGGDPCARLTCTRCVRRTPASHAMLAQIGIVELREGQCYAFSFRARAEGLRSRSATVAITDTDGWHGCGLHKGFRVGASWRGIRHVFRATRTVGETSRLQFWFGEPGTLYVDDVRLAAIDPGDVVFTDTVPPAGGRNLVPDGSFEAGGAGWSSVGEGAGWGNLSRLHGRIEASGGTHGRSFLRIPLGGADTPVLHFDYLRPVVHRELRPLAAHRGWIPVREGSPYTLSCDMRASVDGVRAYLGVRAKDPRDPGGRWGGTRHGRRIRLSTSWKRHAFTFRPARRYIYATVGPDLAEERRVEVDVDAVQVEAGERATPFVPRSPLEIGIRPSAPAGIFTAGEPASLRLRAYNAGASPVEVRVDFRVTDFFDAPADLPAVSLEVGPGESARRDVPLPPDWRGFYRVRARYDVGGRRESRDLRLAIVPRRSSDDSVVGVNHAFATADLIRLARKAGVTWYRDWTLKWQDLQPSPGVFRWERADAQIDRVVREGVHLMALLPPFPSANWISEAPPGLPTKGYPGERLREAWGPRDPDRLADLVRRATARYADRVGVWEFLNEPIYTDYALPGRHRSKYGGKSYTPADYVRLLAKAAAGMRDGDARCRVIGGIGGGPDLLAREVIEAGCLRHVDLFNLHLYPGTRLPETYLAAMDGLLRVMDAHGGRKPIWVTEFSYYAADDLPRRPFIPDARSWAEGRLLESERECAAFTVRFLAIMLARGAEKIFIHSGASGAVNESEFECCLFAYGGAPRKVLPALAVFAELLGPRPRCVAEGRFSRSGHVFGFETGGRAVAAAWTEEEAAAAPRPRTGGLECLDIMGRRIAGDPIPLSAAPIYIVGPAGKARELARALASP